MYCLFYKKSYQVNLRKTLIIMDETVFVGDNSNANSLILSDLWKNYDMHIYLMMKLGYYVEEDNSFAWLNASKDGVILTVILQIIFKTIAMCKYWYQLTKNLVKKLKECEVEEEDSNKNKKKK